MILSKGLNIKNIRILNVKNLVLLQLKNDIIRLKLSRCLSSIPRNGPDQVLEATSYKSWKPNVPVRLQVEEGDEKRAYPPISIPSLLANAAKEYGDNPALLVKEDGKWKSWNYKEYYETSRILAKAFLKLGLEQFHGVCIMGIPSPQWYFTYNASISAGGIAVGIYATNSAEACKYVVNHSKANIIVAQDSTMVDKFIKVLPELPTVKKIIQMEGIPTASGVLSFEELISIGKNETDERLEDRLSTIAINQCCSLIYTSGTTGDPKGVMCSHDNLTWTTNMYKLEAIEYGFTLQAKFVGYLPLNHIAGQLGIPLPMGTGAAMYFAEADAMQGSLLKTLVEVQPTSFYSVPRIWEKMYEGVKGIINKAPPLKKSVLQWAMKQGTTHTQAIYDDRKLSMFETMNHRMAEKFILSPIRQKLGLRDIDKMVSVAAPSSPEVCKFFMGLGLTLTDGYGMSETMTLGTRTMPGKNKIKFGTAGKTHEHMDMKLDYDAVDLEGEGEICFKGRGICMGYMSNQEATDKAIDDDGWLKTGDLGKLDEDGFLQITGRLKELVITAGGENIPPVYIEDQVKKRIPIISNAMLVGDNRHYLTMLLTLKTDMDPSSGAPLPTLTKECQEFLKESGSLATTLQEAIQEVETDPQGIIASSIQNGINSYNENDAISRAQRIQKWRILPNDFSVVTEELNITLKLKRSFVLNKYTNLINQMYE